MESLVFRGPLVPEIGDVKNEKLPFVVEKLLLNRCGIIISPSQDLGQVELRMPSENYPKSILIKFNSMAVRNEIWNSRQSAKVVTILTICENLTLDFFWKTLIIWNDNFFWITSKNRQFTSKGRLSTLSKFDQKS